MRTILSILFLLLISLTLSGQNTVLIKNANVWNGLDANLKKSYDVLVVDNIIEEVEKNITPTENAVIIDAKGKTLIPGLSDAHVHLALTLRPISDLRNKADWMYTSARAVKSAEKFLMLGFMTVRDVGDPVMGLKKAVDEGIVPGPRIYPSGAFISQTSGHGDFRNANESHPHWSGVLHPMDAQGWSFVVDGVPEVLKASRENLKNGATQLKVMAGGGISSEFDPIHSVQFTPEELEAAVQAAADWDTYVTVHIYNSDGIIRALNAGVKCIEHGHLINRGSHATA